MNTKSLREAVRTIIVEAFDDDDDLSIYAKHREEGPPRYQKETEEFEFPVWDPTDKEYIISAIYHRRSPFQMELWKAVDKETGEEFDPDELEEIIPDLQDRAFDFVASKHRD